jgi:hypothetical protein
LLHLMPIRYVGLLNSIPMIFQDIDNLVELSACALAICELNCTLLSQ